MKFPLIVIIPPENVYILFAVKTGLNVRLFTVAAPPNNVIAESGFITIVDVPELKTPRAPFVNKAPVVPLSVIVEPFAVIIAVAALAMFILPAIIE